MVWRLVMRLVMTNEVVTVTVSGVKRLAELEVTWEAAS